MMNIIYRHRPLIGYFLVFIGIILTIGGFIIGLLYVKNKPEVGYAILSMVIIGPGIIFITMLVCMKIEDRMMILERRRLIETV